MSHFRRRDWNRDSGGLTQARSLPWQSRAGSESHCQGRLRVTVTEAEAWFLAVALGGTFESLSS